MCFFTSCVTNISCSRQKESIERTAKDPSDRSASEVPSPPPQKPPPAAAKGGVYVTPEKPATAVPAIRIAATPVAGSSPAGTAGSTPSDEDEDDEARTLCLDGNGIKKKFQE